MGAEGRLEQEFAVLSFWIANHISLQFDRSRLFAEAESTGRTRVLIAEPFVLAFRQYHLQKSRVFPMLADTPRIRKQGMKVFNRMITASKVGPLSTQRTMWTSSISSKQTFLKWSLFSDHLLVIESSFSAVNILVFKYVCLHYIP